MSDTGYYLAPADYDAVYSDYVLDVPVLVAAARAAGGALLEVCCGNGRVLVPMAAAGVDAAGLDRDEAMLADARRKLEARGLHAALHRGDMRDFTLPRRFRTVLIAFNSFLHNLTQADQLATLRCCRQHLEPGGRLLLAAFHPSLAKLMEWSGVEAPAKDIPNPAGGRVRYHDRATDDRIEQIRHMTRRVEFTDDAGNVQRTLTTTFDLRYVWKPEMELLLRVAGFPRWEARPLPGSQPLPDAAAAGGAAAAAPAAAPALREGDTLLWTAWRE